VDQAYYGHVRKEIAPLLPELASRIVDVGCGAGVTLTWLRSFYPAAHTVGLEGNAELKGELERNAHEAHIVDLTREMPDLGSPDLILFLDVLEHLPDPASVLKQFVAQLAQGGSVIVSVPNVAHLSVSVPLILRGEFTYRDAGILDRTHLRFFNRDSAVSLVRDAGLAVDQGLMAGINGPRARMIDALTFGSMRSRLAKQYIVRGVSGRSATGADVTWRLA
jgi:2-polyprenyl-3-methyl-5-hydroxy-6-metoxy-1,4-benzoquinol methylase